MRAWTMFLGCCHCQQKDHPNSENKMSGDSVRVAVRVRPFNGREKDMKASLCIAMEDNTTYIENPSDGKRKPYTFDFSYWSHDEFEVIDGYNTPMSPKYADQQKVFDDVGRDVLDNAVKGFNCSLFAYGQTGSGKSYSMVGYGVNKGIVPITCEELFKIVSSNDNPSMEHHVELSMLEIYNEQVRDLLAKKPTPKGGLKVRSVPKLGVQVVGLSKVPVSSYDEINSWIENGTENRTVAATKMNATSSRAHTVVAIMFTQKQIDKFGPGKHEVMTSKINLVDLAGSERANSTGATGATLKEGSAINLSLTMLGNVITALAEKSNHPKKKILIPYRDSKLTQILQDALGGDSKTIMIAAVSPASVNYDESLSTLRYADRAKQIKTKPKVQLDPQTLKLKKLEEENEKLKAKLAALGLMGEGGEMPDLSALQAGGGVDPEVLKEKEALENELEEHRKAMEQQEAEFQARLEAAKAEFAENSSTSAARSEAFKNTPHLSNLNEDSMLSGVVKMALKEGVNIIGKPGGDATVELAGMGILQEHCQFTVTDDKITLFSFPEARLLLNGKQTLAESE
eukprot:TRINITY_DN1093_c1_g2_i2.p1 TRINITY_DN1093_c1_g2~~TRINITY_DN1093_c1_g2_i2.p1  ORF type:complete len:570 (-),score=202.76 TRINITY_DN1093_c1_g2_i2:56-1765(-)